MALKLPKLPKIKKPKLPKIKAPKLPKVKTPKLPTKAGVAAGLTAALNPQKILPMVIVALYGIIIAVQLWAFSQIPFTKTLGSGFGSVGVLALGAAGIFMNVSGSMDILFNGAGIVLGLIFSVMTIMEVNKVLSENTEEKKTEEKKA